MLLIELDRARILVYQGNPIARLTNEPSNPLQPLPWDPQGQNCPCSTCTRRRTLFQRGSYQILPSDQDLLYSLLRQPPWLQERFPELYIHPLEQEFFAQP